jgi:hypothetical protein
MKAFGAFTCVKLDHNIDPCSFWYQFSDFLDISDCKQKEYTAFYMHCDYYFSFLRIEHKLSNLSKVSQLVNGRIRI